MPMGKVRTVPTPPARPPARAQRRYCVLIFWRVAVKPFVLSDTPASTSRFRNGHYLIPDTNIFLYCMDIIEHHSAFYDVIVLQIVLEELRNRSLPLYNRLRALTTSQDKRFYVFHNEFRKETYVKRLPGETINDRNDRAVRVACKWYKSHLQEAVAGTTNRCPEIVMLSDDRGNLEKARVDGVACCNSRFEWNRAERPD
jgi:exosome complex exonuclease DIS3/RRP44